MMASTQAKNNTPCVQCRFSRHNITQRVISAALIVRLGRGRRGHSRFLRGLQRAVCSLRGWKTRLLASIFFKSGNRTRGRGRMKNRPKNRKLPDFRISGKKRNSGKTAYHSEYQVYCKKKKILLTCTHGQNFDEKFRDNSSHLISGQTCVFLTSTTHHIPYQEGSTEHWV